MQAHTSLNATLPEPSLLTLEEAALFLKVSPDTVRRMVRRGQLTSLKVGRRSLRFTRQGILSDLQKPAEMRVAYSRPRVIL
jgi:excisionase family DNA binding protein